MDLFKLPAGTTDQLYKQVPPLSPTQINVELFPMQKNEATRNQDVVQVLFEALNSEKHGPEHHGLNGWLGIRKLFHHIMCLLHLWNPLLRLLVPLTRIQRLLRRTSKYQTSPCYHLHLRPLRAINIFCDSSHRIKSWIKAIVSSHSPPSQSGASEKSKIYWTALNPACHTILDP